MPSNQSMDHVRAPLSPTSVSILSPQPFLQFVGASVSDAHCARAPHGESTGCARDVQIVDATLSVVGGDLHNHYYSFERSTDIWAILHSIPNFRTIYQDMLSKATPGTGMWLLKSKRFSLWLEPSGNIKILWGSGIPGAGKTLLASIVIEHLEALYQGADNKICICYVYFRYSDHSEVTVRNVLEIFVNQTLERHPDCLALVELTYARHIRERTKPTEGQLLGLLFQLSERIPATFYILDALDEAPTSIQLAIVKTLITLNVKLFITSRPLRTVEANIPQAHSFTIVAQDADLDLHIAKGMDEGADLQDLLRRGGPSLREEIVSTIKRNCGGMFLHAALQLDALRNCLSIREVRNVLSAFPSRISDVYRQTWARLSDQSHTHASLAKFVLVWVLYASKSMTVEELEKAVATSPTTYKYEPDRLVSGSTLISLCHGLVAVEEESGLVRLVHYTAKATVEGLLRESFPSPHSLLAAVCITHLAECGFQNTTIGCEKDFKTALKTDPLLAYAAEAWAVHAHESLSVNSSWRRTANFIAESIVFPAFTSFDRTWYFDILSPLHIFSLYHLPLVLGNALVGDPNVVTQLGQQSPLIVASRSGNEGLVAFLLALPEIQVNLLDVDGCSALMRAADVGHEGIAALLLAHPDTNINLVNSEGCSALMLASFRGSKGIVSSLLTAKDLDVNAVNGCGDTAIKLAVEEGHEEIVQVLLEYSNIDTTIRSAYDGHTAMSIAMANGYNSIVQLMQEYSITPSSPDLSPVSHLTAEQEGFDSDNSDAYEDAEEGLESDIYLPSPSTN